MIGKIIPALSKFSHRIIKLPRLKRAKVLECKILASNFHFFSFQAEKPLHFLPGQYISVKVDNKNLRSYSIAIKEGDKEFSLLVDTSPGGPGSKFFENLKKGEEILFLGPFGTFTLKMRDKAKKLVFLGTGSGCAPLRCQIEAALKEKNPEIEMYLYHGLTYPKDLFWQDVFQNLAKEHSNFHYKVVIWKSDKSWWGETGFITQALEKELTNGKEIAAYLCGNKEMIADATKILREKGCPKRRIYTEKY
ncbi:MAG: FAD-dependent oxidoreductase [Candidatus Daviesbacteria bacterium]